MKMLNRWIATAIAGALIATTGLARAAADCTTASDVAAVQADVKANLDTVRQDQKKLEAGIDREFERRASVDGWTKDDQSKVLMRILGSPQFFAFEKEKQAFTTEMMSIAMSGPPKGQKPDPKATCADGLRLKAIVGQVQAINAREYAFMLDEVKATK